MRRLLCLLVLVSGCDLYWNQGDDDCEYYATSGAEGDIAPAPGVRNPNTGECEYWGGGYGCDNPCAPCAGDDLGRPEPAALPDWASCQSACTGLTEAACVGQAGCQASYDLAGSAAATFAGCFETAPSGPVSSGTCTGLDAHECTRHDNCATYYNPGSFSHCAAETSGACSGIQCGPGYHCEAQCKDTCVGGGDCGPQCGAMCVPDGNVCAAVDCGPGYECVEICVEPTPTHAGQCYAQCHPTTSCEAITTEAACAARTDCTTVYNGDDCTCTPTGGCTCEILTYDHCESLHPQPL
ncbi:MAG: hypothetical protein JNL83_09705 [Myxococcales bacterium]|nr:hypothetical protein [Myxococcales bacterium]